MRDHVLLWEMMHSCLLRIIARKSGRGRMGMAREPSALFTPPLLSGELLILPCLSIADVLV